MTTTKKSAADAATVAEPRLPNSVVRILALSRQPNVSPAEIERHLVADAGLAATILRLANSVVFCLNRRIESLREAVVVLGLGRLETLALFYGFAGVLRRDLRGFGYTRTGLLDHSIAVAVCARALAQRIWQDARTCDQLFVAGLLHELPLVYRVTAAQNGERWRFLDPAKKALLALQWWRIDPDVIELVRQQRAQQPAAELRRQVAALRFAKALAGMSRIGLQPDADVAAVHEADLELLALHEHGVWQPLSERLLEQLDTSVPALSALLSA
jgi:HD-like signal output (HDOD) protein